MPPSNRLPFAVDSRTDESRVTARAGVPLVVALFRAYGAAVVTDARAARRAHGRTP